MRESSDEPIVTIAETLSDALDTPIEELSPLSQSINLEALAEIVTDNRSQDVKVAFSYAAHRVVIHSDNTVYVRPVQNDNTVRWNTDNFDE